MSSSSASKEHHRPGRPLPVWLFVPNLLGYLRVALLLGGWFAAATQPAFAAGFLLSSIALDAVDGWAARALGQVSEFGAFLDVLIDNATRGLLWCLALDRGASPAAVGDVTAAALHVPGLCLVPVLVEMSTLLATHKEGGAAWKDGCFREAPDWVRWVMASRFQTPQGALVLSGLFGLPLWLWCLWAFPEVQRLVPGQAQMLLTGALLCGRGLAAAVELWVLQRHLGAILASDARAHQQRLAEAWDRLQQAPQQVQQQE